MNLEIHHNWTTPHKSEHLILEIHHNWTTPQKHTKLSRTTVHTWENNPTKFQVKWRHKT